ncbi:DUF3696 domain-containing protein [Pannus brasiliensis CCIBt3594]|uniref:DUF3696 domain-containing protein n=1 Tax=Pannus brasiliensis CCIBt3594 TaxID=1427578 RepID=A0AAW9QQR7_9CHRO
MFKNLRFQNFKSWKDTGDIELAPITGFFGTNSSGKSTILQFLLMLKQTVESSDRKRVLYTGDDRSYVDLGTLYDIAYHHNIPSQIIFDIEWQLPYNNSFMDCTTIPGNLMIYRYDYLKFTASIQLKYTDIFVNEFHYRINNLIRRNSQTLSFGMKRNCPDSQKELHTSPHYELVTEGYNVQSKSESGLETFFEPLKSYGFPNQALLSFINTDFLSDFTLAFEKAFQKIYYLGPLREYPKRFYSWAGERPQDVGRRGELSIPALLASRNLEKIKSREEETEISLEEKIAIWLKKLGLIDSFRVEPIAENRQYYEVRVRRSPNSSEVLITEIGFGVSQILPVLVLCYYVPEGSTIILEQPEIHLHPSIQAGLADVFIDAIKTRDVQIILESHSEHLLRRLQRRVAEEKDGLTAPDIQLYFCSSQENGDSQLRPLQIDRYGNIMNWPENFFGDKIGDFFAVTEAAMKRQMENE